MKNNSFPTPTSTTEQGHLVSLHLDTSVTCPECSHTFALREGLGNATIAQLQARQAEFLSAREQELQTRIEQESAAAAEKAARDMEQCHTVEKRRIEQQLKTVQAENAGLIEQQESLAKERQNLAAERRTLTAERSKMELKWSRKLDEASAEARKQQEELKEAHEAELLKAKEASVELGRKQASTEQSETLSRLTAEVEASRKQAVQHTKMLQKAEIDKLKMEERLQSQEHALEVEIQKQTNKLRKQLEAEYARLNQSRTAEAVESERSKAALKLRAAEVEKSQLLVKVEQLHRQLEQKSQQVQGEALETLLETRLRGLCPGDAVETVKTGTAGADILHSVYNDRGEHVGNISWEYKDRKKWSAGWLAKLAKDARECGSSAAVLVTTAMPKNMTGKVAYLDGCWVCAVDAWEGLTLLLRAQVIEMARLRKGLERREDKASKAYESLQSETFRSAASTMLNTLSAMETQVASEERALSKQWKLRRDQIKALVALHMDHMQTIEVITAQDIVTDDFFTGDAEAR